jgi:hypothetical protein
VLTFYSPVIDKLFTVFAEHPHESLLTGVLKHPRKAELHEAQILIAKNHFFWGLAELTGVQLSGEQNL